MNGKAPKQQLEKDTLLESRDADHWTNFFGNLIPWYELPDVSRLGARVWHPRRDAEEEPPRHDRRRVRGAAAGGG